MALSNYTDLAASVIDWTHRADLTSVIADFVKLAEVRIAQDLNIQATETTSTFVTVAGTVGYSFPAGMMSLERAWITDVVDTPLAGFDPDLAAFDVTLQLPRYYYIENNQFNLSPAPDKVYTVSIVHKSRLNLQTSTTNEVMTNYPNIYLFSTLIEACNYIGGDALNKVQMYEQRYKQAIKDANKSEDYKDSNLLATEIPMLNNRYYDIRSM